MLLSKTINFDRNLWKLIQQKYQHVIEQIVDGKSFKKIISGTELTDLGNVLNDQISSISGQSHQIKSAILFGQPVGHTMEIHVDGFSLNRKNASNWALNLPIIGTGAMVWFDGSYELSEFVGQQQLKYLKLTWHDDPIEIERRIIDQPTVVRIDLPHQVINLSTTPRLLLSVRFSPDIY